MAKAKKTTRRRAHKAAAVLTLHRPGRMSSNGRRAIAAWLRRQAQHFEKHGVVYSETRFTARYLF